MSVVLPSRLSYCHAQKLLFLPPIHKSGSYPTCGSESGFGATWSECGDTAQVLSAEGEKWRYPRKNSLFETASIAAGIPPAALLVGQKPEPTLIGIRKRRMIT